MEDFDLEKLASELAPAPKGLIPLRKRSKLSIPTDADGKRLHLSSDQYSPRGRKRPADDISGSEDSAPEASQQQKPGEKKHRRRRSAGSREKRRQIAHEQRQVTSVKKRTEGTRARGVFAPVSGNASVNARLCFHPEQLITQDSECSRFVRDFYQSQGFENTYVEVSEAPNVSNPKGVKGGGKGVFALTKLAEGTWVCPYVGSLRHSRCPARQLCQYDMQVRRGVYVCAREHKYDIGYLYYDPQHKYSATDRGLRKSAIHQEVPAPPNYGRYVNSLTEAQRTEGRQFNCRFVTPPDCPANEVFIETTKTVRKGEELLCDYGNEFLVG